MKEARQSPEFEFFSLSDDPLIDAQELPGYHGYLSQSFVDTYIARKKAYNKEFLAAKSARNGEKAPSDEVAKITAEDKTMSLLAEERKLEGMLKSLELKARMLELVSRRENSERRLS